jgi:Zn-dependent protease with chaperone function
MRNYFRGTTSLRVRGEWLSLWLTLLFLPMILVLVGPYFHAEGLSTVVLLAVFAMVYVTLARGQLLGSSLLIHKAQFPEVFDVVERCSALVGIPVPLVFVRDDILVPVVTLGFGEPYSLVLSSHWLKHFEPDELTFMIGRELGNIAAGHTRLTSLLSVNGRENPLIAVLFGAWLRRTELTADRFGLLCCGSVEAAERAITIATFHHFGREIDISAFKLQGVDFGADSILNMGEWLSSAPYATKRMERLRHFYGSSLFAYWEEQLLRNPIALEAFTPVPRKGHVTRADCAGFGRRLGVLAIDFFVILSIFSLTPDVTRSPDATAPHKNVVTLDNAALGKVVKDATTGQTPDPAALAKLQKSSDGQGGALNMLLRFVGVLRNGDVVTITPLQGLPQEFMIYSFILVALSGQTLGMMILAVKVTTTKFGRPPVWLALWRALVSPFGILTFALGPFARIELHDRLSGTRVVPLERTFERAPAAS